MNGLAPLLIGLLGVAVVGRALVIGSASVDGQGFLRDKKPMFYWTIVAVGIAITCFCFYQAFAPSIRITDKDHEL